MNQQVWTGRKGRGGRATPKGRQLDDAAVAELATILGPVPRRRDLLIEHLHLIQDARGSQPAPLLRALADALRIPMAEVWEVATFYAHFDPIREDQAPPPALTIRVCDSLSCELAGAAALQARLEAGVDPLAVRVVRAPCMGRCDTAPIAEVGHNMIDHATPEAVLAAAQAGDIHPHVPDYEAFDAYRAGGGYDQFLALQKGGDWQAVQAQVTASGLRGLGGAGFPSGKKWGFVRAHPGPRLMAVNADEGEPGTFKDRYYLEHDPHLFLEGMLIAAWAVEAERIYVYLRDEYPAARHILRREIAALEGAGIVAPGFVELRRGAGAYICGEESAMIESIEGKRGIPRQRPPFVAEVGVFGRPTLVHNVETLHWVARVLREGPEVLAGYEKNGRTGLRSYSVSGRVAKPGVYLLPAGSTIRDLIDAAGGMAKGHDFAAYQPGGASSGFLPASLDHVPLDFDTLQPHGSFIGSAAVVVLGHKDPVRDAALNSLRFFADESCGQCTPCRVGCIKAVTLMQEKTWDRALLHDLCTVMEDASICGLGQAAPNAIRLTMKHFSQEV